MTRAWIAVASAEHVRLGRSLGFMQVCHGKDAPLRRLRPGDAVIYYSPSERMGSGSRLQAFTALGHVKEGVPYQVEMAEGFHPFRRDVDWSAAAEAPIAPLPERLSFTVGRRNWGAKFRFGLFQIGEADLALIAAAMATKSAVVHVKKPGSGGGQEPQNFPFWFFHASRTGMVSSVSQCSAILPFSTRNRS